MKVKIILCVLGILFTILSCRESNSKDISNTETIKTIENSQEFKELSSDEKEMVLLDLESVHDKENYLKEEGADVWYNTKCSTCGNICCRSCTADGDPYRCAETRFTKCSKCGHGKSSHFADRQ